jgi:chemotaxis response regulator CheB
MKLNVIVIDDSLVQLALASQIIKKNEQLNLLGTYSDPFLGLQAANQLDVDVVLLDVEMHEIDGFSLQKLLKESVQVIINSTRSSFELFAYLNGAIDFLQKPLNDVKVKRAVARVVEMKSILSVKNTVRTTIAS